MRRRFFSSLVKRGWMSFRFHVIHRLSCNICCSLRLCHVWTLLSLQICSPTCLHTCPHFPNSHSPVPPCLIRFFWTWSSLPVLSWISLILITCCHLSCLFSVSDYDLHHFHWLSCCCCFTEKSTPLKFHFSGDQVPTGEKVTFVSWSRLTWMFLMWDNLPLSFQVQLPNTAARLSSPCLFLLQVSKFFVWSEIISLVEHLNTHIETSPAL